jgi:hypothetical protein
MTEEKYMEIQTVIGVTAAFVRELDLQGFLAAIDKAESVGPIIDPTLYLKSHRQMNRIREAADVLLTFQKVCKEYGI